jgi:hypothetical protein
LHCRKQNLTPTDLKNICRGYLLKVILKIIQDKLFGIRQSPYPFVGRGLAPAVFLFSTHVAVGEHSICSRKRKGGYGIRPYNIMEIYLFFRREQATALRYEIVFSAKNAEAMDSVFLYN